jgi:K+-sensing histidine kinase KdpD
VDGLVLISKSKTKFVEILVVFLGLLAWDMWSSVSLAEIQPNPLLIVVLLFGLRYGWKIGLVASLASIIYILGNVHFNGGDMFLNLIDFDKTKQLFFMLAMGVIPGLFSTNLLERYEDQYYKSEELAVNNKILSETVEQLTESREILEEKVLESEHSLFTVLEIVKSLNTEEPEAVITQSIKTFSSLFHFEKFGIYQLDKSGNVLRLKAGMGFDYGLESTILIEDSPFFQRILDLKTVQMRRIDDNESDPILAGPLMRKGQVNEILVIHNLPMYQLKEQTLHMVSLMLDLVSRSLERAELHHGETIKNLTYPQTTIYKMDAFNSRVELERSRKSDLDQPFVICNMSLDRHPPLSLKEWEQTLRAHMREVDLIGYDEVRNSLMFLLPSTMEDKVDVFLGRISQAVCQPIGGKSWVS